MEKNFWRIQSKLERRLEREANITNILTAWHEYSKSDESCLMWNCMFWRLFKMELQNNYEQWKIEEAIEEAKTTNKVLSLTNIRWEGKTF